MTLLDRAAKLGEEPCVSKAGVLSTARHLLMPSINGFTCSLTIDSHDDPATEHGAKQEGLDYASAYVVAEGHKRFSLTVTGAKYVHPSLDVGIWIDGKYQDGRIMDKLSDKKFEFREKFTGKEEKQGRKLVKKLWKFGALNVVGEQTVDCEDERDVLLNLGTIEIVILRCDNSKLSKSDDDEDDESPESSDVQPHPRAKAYWRNWENDQNPSLRRLVKPTLSDSTEKPIYETHLKGRDIRHRVITEKEFGVQRRIREKKIEYLDSFENPHCIMVLKYRSRVALQNMDLIPRTPLPAPSLVPSRPSPSSLSSSLPLGTDEAKRLEGLSREEIVRELLALKAENAKIKQEEQEGRATKRIKLEREPVGGLVIDLTD